MWNHSRENFIELENIGVIMWNGLKSGVNTFYFGGGQTSETIPWLWEWFGHP
jgi:hypothetical protein